MRSAWGRGWLLSKNCTSLRRNFTPRANPACPRPVAVWRRAEFCPGSLGHLGGRLQAHLPCSPPASTDIIPQASIPRWVLLASSLLMMTRPGRWQSTGAKPREARKHYAKTLPHPVPYPWPRTLWAAICLSCQELAICLSRASHSLCVSSSVPLPSLRLRHLQPGLLGQNQGFLLIHQPLRHPGVLISMCDSSFLFIFPLSLYSLLLLLLL